MPNSTHFGTSTPTLCLLEQKQHFSTECIFLSEVKLCLGRGRHFWSLAIDDNFCHAWWVAEGTLLSCSGSWIGIKNIERGGVEETYSENRNIEFVLFYVFMFTWCTRIFEKQIWRYLINSIKASKCIFNSLC